MNKWQEMVARFHAKMQQPAPVGPTMREYRPRLRVDLILEEAKEFCEASGFEVACTRFDGEAELRAAQKPEEAYDRVAMIDALCDIIYVACGAAVEMGVDLDEYLAEVHRSNMQKAGGPVRADGKVLKPAGWTPPNIAGVLAREEAFFETLRDVMRQARMPRMIVVGDRDLNPDE